ncbi:suv3 RNA helicase isoform X2 [Calliopsis andreniformis]|uniref:suv3 RNA helicase isoform X2 n=1 Tax=Calliopsis andreniformis TaxID=337506 RepID=UPI003FCCF33F
MIPFKRIMTSQIKRRKNLFWSPLSRQLNPTVTFNQSIREKNGKSNLSIGSLFQPVPVKQDSNNFNVGAELTGALNKVEIMKILNKFSQKKIVKDLALQYGLDDCLLNIAFNGFRQYCVESKSLPADLHVIFSDIIHGVGNIVDIFPYFLRYVKQVYPHVDCLDDLKKISDLRDPPSWYPHARAKQRKIIFHAGPTNSGKTYHALKRFMEASSGVYCGPLKLLAVEVFNKCNAMGTPCDLITGEEQTYVNGKMSPVQHVACSVEMVNVQNVYEVAILDEIQLIRDPSRGWAWTRALLGVVADEIHVCGEAAAIPIIESICATIGETVQVEQYKRLTDLVIEKYALRSLFNVQPGDCIVCFNKNDIFYVSQNIEKIGKQVAVIYGSLPPATKLAQAARFNDVNDPCKILVATNAIGMGLNLHIRRIVFYSLSHPTINENGEKEIDTISVSSALQIAGRAGRYGTQWSQGFVTTFKSEDLTILRKLLTKTPDIIKQAGLHPTADQIELYAYYLPHAPLSNLINIFITLSQVDNSLYFICNLDDFKFLADMIQHIPLPLRTRYVFCCAPINRKMPFVCSMFLKFARQCSNNDKITKSWLCKQVNWPLSPPANIADLVHLEAVFDVFDIYLWLSFRFMDLFPDGNSVREIQQDLDKVIEKGVQKLGILFQKSKTGTSEETNLNSKAEFRSDKYSKDEYSLRHKRGRLSDALISQGLLTPKLLEQLQMEWSDKAKKEKEHTKDEYEDKNSTENKLVTRPGKLK